MNSAQTVAPLGPDAAIPWRVVPPLASTALIMLGSGFLGSLLPLRLSAMGLSDGVIGLIATAEALGFLTGCLYAHRVIAPVGLERAYATFASLKSVAILGLYFAESLTACLLNGLILTAFTTVGPLFGVRIGFDQQRTVLLMACVSRSPPRLGGRRSDGQRPGAGSRRGGKSNCSISRGV